MDIKIRIDENLPVKCQNCRFGQCFQQANKLVVFEHKCSTYPGKKVSIGYYCDWHFEDWVEGELKPNIIEVINIWPPHTV